MATGGYALLHELDPETYPAADKVREDCEFFVRKMIASASPAEKSALIARANGMIQSCFIVSGY
jgi:hypothetical protein